MKEAMMVTNADKKANTPAYQNMKKGMKDKDGKPMYKAADHMKEATHSKDIQGYADAYSDVQEMSYGYQGGGMVKKVAKKKGKKPVVHLDKPDKLVSIKIKESGIFTEEELSKLLWLEFDEGYQRNPEADPQNKPYRQKSKKERMADPDRGINSPAFKKFMASQGMQVTQFKIVWYNINISNTQITMINLRDDILKNQKTYYNGLIAKHQQNVEIYLNQPVGIGEHSDVMAAIDTEINAIAQAHEKIGIIDSYFLGR